MYQLINSNAFDWLKHREDNSIHAVVTDPPYGVKEYTTEELQKKRNGTGGIWRIPNRIGNSNRQPSPRFSVINDSEVLRKEVEDFFEKLSKELYRVLVPGGHIIMASTPLLSDIVSKALRSNGFERRGELVRVVKTLRGGDKPKNSEEEFSMVTVIPRGHWEPWLIFRKPISERTVAENLKKWGTGGLKRISEERPFADLIISEKTGKSERNINSHSSIKPQSFMRQIVEASLPMGTGVILDPFAGSGSTLAAAEYLALDSIGIESDYEYYLGAKKSIPILAKLSLEDIKLYKK